MTDRMEEIAVYGVLCPEGREHPAAWRLLELALEREFQMKALPEVGRGEGGKPFFPDDPHLCFNLSHSRGAAVCALHTLPIGVDVERLRPAPRRLARGMTDGEFFRAWTAREASIKREGLPWTALLRDREPDGTCRWLEELLPGWVVAVCPTKNDPIRAVRIGPEELRL